jgi:flagellar hook-length control protein FliK
MAYMAGIKVLSDALKAGDKIAKASTIKGKTAEHSAKRNATIGFAEVLKGKINPTADSKGQNSKAGQDSEDKQDIEDPMQSTQSQIGLGSSLGYGSPFQAMLQNDLPAGKEANSGNVVGQGNLLSQDSDQVSAQLGMTVAKQITELDKNKQIIADLIEKLSGEIKNIPPKSENMDTKNLSQIAKVIQGWLLDDSANDDQTSSVQKEIQSLLDKSSGILEDKGAINQNSNIGIGLANNILATNDVDGKSAAIPVFAQIATAFRGQVLNGHQAMKELDIQLHPAELGKIQIAMRWENGQVHMQVQASEAATGHLLQNQLSDLRHALTDQGINCGMLQMGQDREQQKNPHGDTSQSKLNQDSLPNEDENTIPVFNQLALGEDGLNLINVTA